MREQAMLNAICAAAFDRARSLHDPSDKARSVTSRRISASADLWVYAELASRHSRISVVVRDAVRMVVRAKRDAVDAVEWAVTRAVANASIMRAAWHMPYSATGGAAPNASWPVSSAMDHVRVVPSLDVIRDACNKVCR